MKQACPWHDPGDRRVPNSCLWLLSLSLYRYLPLPSFIFAFLFFSSAVLIMFCSSCLFSSVLFSYLLFSSLLLSSPFFSSLLFSPSFVFPFLFYSHLRRLCPLLFLPVPSVCSFAFIFCCFRFFHFSFLFKEMMCVCVCVREIPWIMGQPTVGSLRAELAAGLIAQLEVPSVDSRAIFIAGGPWACFLAWANEAPGFRLGYQHWTQC